MSNELFNLNNAFYLGNFTRCVHEAGVLSRLQDAKLKTQRDVVVARAYLAMGRPSAALTELEKVDSAAPGALRAVKLHAQLLDEPKKKEEVLLALKDVLADPANAADEDVQIVAATLYQSVGDSRSALRVMRGFTGASATATPSLQSLAFGVQIYLSMNLVDKAHALMKRMQELDDDATLTQLSCAWVYLAVGGTKYEEAFYIFQELKDKYGDSVPLLNGLAVASLHQSQYDQASTFLLAALDKNPSNPDTLVNLIVCAQLNSKQKEADRYLRDLRKYAPEHPWLVRYETVAASFDRT